MNRIKQKADQLRKKYGGRDIFETVANSGANVWFRELGSLKGFYLCENGSRYIIVNQSLDDIVARTVCAHEFGHDMLHRELSAGGIRENSLFLANNKTEREANLFAAEILITDREALSVLEYAADINQAAYELGVMPEIVEYKLELLNSAGYSFNVSGAASDFLK